ncbi:hypothetical protein [Nocardioides hungaricus]
MVPNLRIERIVRLQLAGGGVISALETVYGATTTDFEAAFATTAADLEALVNDQELLKSLTS